MLFVSIFYDHNMKLPWQKHDRHHRGKGQSEPARIGYFGRVEAKQVKLFGETLGKLVENIAESVKQAKGDKNTNRQKRPQFDERFKGDRRHQPLMTFRSIEVARSEEHAEQAKN